MRSPNRRELLRALSLVFLAQNPFVAEAATTPPLKCSRVGQTLIWRGKKYTCILSGKKHVWNKGVAIAAPKKIVTPTKTPLSIYTPASIEYLICASTELKLNQPISFANPSLADASRGYIVMRREKEIVAFSNRCTHEGAEIEVKKGELVCFRHLSYFDPVSGNVLSGPATRELKRYQATEHDAKVFVIDLP